MTNGRTISTDEADASIDRLLVKSESVSIVDGLFDLADGGMSDIADIWNSVVASRLQARLAERMKRTIKRHAA